MGKNRRMDETFVIRVKDCQHHTWQGTILWANNQKEVAFRSVLEMIKLMDSALGEEENR